MGLYMLICSRIPGHGVQSDVCSKLRSTQVLRVVLTWCQRADKWETCRP